MMFKQVLFDDFESMLLQKLQEPCCQIRIWIWNNGEIPESLKINSKSNIQIYQDRFTTCFKNLWITEQWTRQKDRHKDRPTYISKESQKVTKTVEKSPKQQ